MRVNFFRDPKGNVLNIEFEESLIVEKKFCGSYKILSFYNLNEVYYACTLFNGDRNFKLWVFTLD